jgi:hypothetical protein
MVYLFIIQVVLFCFFIANVGKLFINLLIDKQ